MSDDEQNMRDRHQGDEPEIVKIESDEEDDANKKIGWDTTDNSHELNDEKEAEKRKELEKKQEEKSESKFSMQNTFNSLKATVVSKVQEAKEIIREKMNTVFTSEDEKEIILENVTYEEKGKGMSSFIAYQIKGKDSKGEFEVQRRFREFKKIREVLKARWPGMYIPPIAPSAMVITPQILEERQIQFDQFLQKLAIMKHLFYSEEFQVFLRNKEPELEKTLDQVFMPATLDLIQKYFASFPYLKMTESTPEQLVQVYTFQGILKKNLVLIDTYRDMVQKLSDNRERIIVEENSLATFFFPEYEKNNLLFYFNGDESKCINLNNNQRLTKTVTSLNESSKENPYKMFFAELYQEIREIEAMLEAIAGREQIEAKRESMAQEIKEIEIDVAQVTAGSKTLKSMMFKGTGKEYIEYQQQQSENIKEESQILESLSKVVVVYLSDIEMDYFKREKEFQYKSILKRISEVEIAHYQNKVAYWTEIENSSRKISIN